MYTDNMYNMYTDNMYTDFSLIPKWCFMVNLIYCLYSDIEPKHIFKQMWFGAKMSEIISIFSDNDMRMVTLGNGPNYERITFKKLKKTFLISSGQSDARCDKLSLTL